MYIIEKQGLGGITARIVADSISLQDGTRLTTFELEYPRFIHSEFMTHRALSKNAASSRAIPVPAMLKHIAEFPQRPVSWGKNMPGMQAKELLDPETYEKAVAVWDRGREQALAIAADLHQLGVHKQIVNRRTEPDMQMKVVASGTDDGWANFFWLRNHPDAQPEIQELARVMFEAYNAATPTVLVPGEWHLPYISIKRNMYNQQVFSDHNDTVLSLDDARKVSASCCAQVSYRKLDDSLEKALDIYDKLVTSVPVHASPIEHQATPIDYIGIDLTGKWEPGVTHVTKEGHLYSGNFKSWIQNRQLVPNNAKKVF